MAVVRALWSRCAHHRHQRGLPVSLLLAQARLDTFRSRAETRSPGGAKCCHQSGPRDTGAVMRRLPSIAFISSPVWCDAGIFHVLRKVQNNFSVTSSHHQFFPQPIPPIKKLTQALASSTKRQTEVRRTTILQQLK